MSRGQTPRTPRYFPRMKIRGAQRRYLAPYQRLARAFDLIDQAAMHAAAAFMLVADLMVRAALEEQADAIEPSDRPTTGDTP